MNRVLISWRQRYYAQRWKMAIAWFATLAIGVTALLLIPGVYRSEGKLFVRLGRENVTLDPTASFGQGPISAIPLSRDSEINTIVETLRSRILLEHVVDELTPEVVLADQHNWYDDLLPQRLPQRERAIAKLGKMFEVAALRKSNVIKVACDARDPDLACQAVELFVDRFLDYHRGLNRNPGAHNFFAEQTQLVGQQLHESEAKLLEFKNETGVVSLDEQRRLLLAHCDMLRQDWESAEAERKEAEAAIVALKQQLKTYPERLVMETTIGHPNHATDNMREPLYALQLREKELSSKYTDDHVLLRQLRAQLTDAVAVYQSEKGSRTQVMEGRNRTYEQAEMSLANRETQFALLAARVEARRHQLDAVQNEVAALNEAEAKVARLERDLELHRGAYLKYAESLEQSRIDESLESGRISNIAVAEPPVASHRTISPNRPLIVSVVLLCATLAAGAVALASKHLASESSLPRESESFQDYLPTRCS